MENYLYKSCNFYINLILYLSIGSMPEWLKGADCKSAGFAYVGSNPTRPNYSLRVNTHHLCITLSWSNHWITVFICYNLYIN